MRLSIIDGLSVDFSYLYEHPWAVSEKEIEEAAPVVSRAAKEISKIRETGEGPNGEYVRFPHLPNLFSDASLWSESEAERYAKLLNLVKDLDAVISVGIGGSYLGNRALFDALKGAGKGAPSVYFAGFTADPEAMGELLLRVKAEATKKEGAYRVLVLCISKSGTTVEPAGALSVLQSELPKITPDVTYAAVSGRDANLLHEMCHENGWMHFYVPEGIGGRFSVLSQVGMIFAAAIGLNPEEILAGARDAEAACQSEKPKENPAFFLALLKYLATAHHGITAEITMPYSERLRTFSQWYSQLLGESLGKKLDTTGRIIHSGRIAVSAVGTTDMHSVTQEHQEGKRNKLLQFISVRHPAYDIETEIIEAGKRIRVPMSAVNHAALLANARALAAEERMSVTLETEAVDAYHLGALFYFFELAIAYEGALWGIDAYNQPGVEAYKKFLHGDLRKYGE